VGLSRDAGGAHPVRHSRPVTSPIGVQSDSAGCVVSWGMRTPGTQTRSPIRRPVRRVAGESLYEELHDRYLFAWAMRIAFAEALVYLAALEWLWMLLGIRLSPYTYTILAVGVSAWTWWSIRRSFDAARNIRLGLEGERAVADTLTALAEDGYRVFHDLPSQQGDGNIDHVLVGPAGVFAIETKTRRKPVGDGRAARVCYDGEAVRVGEGPRDTGPVVQARAAGDEVKRYLEGTTGLKVRVVPVVLYPGWHVEDEPGAKAVRATGPWVLNDRAFLKWVAQEEHRRGVLPQADLRLIVDRLERWPARGG
jgi:hypothetical protein